LIAHADAAKAASAHFRGTSLDITLAESLIKEGNAFTYDTFGVRTTSIYPVGLAPQWVSWTGRVKEFILSRLGVEHAATDELNRATKIRLVGFGSDEFVHAKSLYIGAVTTARDCLMAAEQFPARTRSITHHPDRRKVFIVHGRQSSLNGAMSAFLRSIGLSPIEWSEAVALVGKPSPYIHDVLAAAFESAQAIVVLMTPDDVGRLGQELVTPTDGPHEVAFTRQARLNVIFEAGMAFGTHPDRTVLVQIGDLRPFSDTAGRHLVHMNNSSTRRQDLAERLRSAGCEISLVGRDWHSAGDFTPPIVSSIL